MTNPHLKPSGSLSDTYLWYFQEKAKQAKGQENDIDLAEIQCALRGVKNKWYNCVKSNPSLFNGPKHDWQKMQEAYAHEKLLRGMPF